VEKELKIPTTNIWALREKSLSRGSYVLLLCFVKPPFSYIGVMPWMLPKAPWTDIWFFLDKDPPEKSFFFQDNSISDPCVQAIYSPWELYIFSFPEYSGCAFVSSSLLIMCVSAEFPA
jgi:hypothetical protein